MCPGPRGQRRTIPASSPVDTLPRSEARTATECWRQASALAPAMERAMRLRSHELRHAGHALLRHLDARLAADVERRALVQLGGENVEDANGAVARRSTRLLDDEAERIRLVKETQLAPRGLTIGRIREDAAAKKIAMEVGDE